MKCPTTRARIRWDIMGILELEKLGKEMLDAEQQELLSRKISELPLRIEGTHLEELIFQLYKELETAGVFFKPKTYLSDDWGCPNKVPVIGMPFYLADPRLCSLKNQLTGIRVEDDMTIMMLLRHEAGHTFNYAYRLYDRPDWRKLFGQFSLPYEEEYKVDPFSTRFVHHLSGWYAQRHPDDDFAETFAIWLTPYSDWRKGYAGTSALVKLLYVDKVVAMYNKKPPEVTGGKLDMPVEEMMMTLGEWYQMPQKYHRYSVTHPRF
jgi:hypothetical protein